MQTLNYIIEQGVNVIIDCHVYQRWCPMNVPGTGCCLEPGFDTPSRKYSMNQDTDLLCPFKLNSKGSATVLQDS